MQTICEELSKVGIAQDSAEIRTEVLSNITARPTW
jgi:hypothetical protein